MFCGIWTVGYLSMGLFFLDPKDSIVHVVTLTKKDCWVQNVMTMLNIGYPSKVQCEKNQVSISVNLLKEKAADTLGVTSMLSNSVNNKYSCDRRMKDSVTTLLFSAHPLLSQLMSLWTLKLFSMALAVQSTYQTQVFQILKWNDWALRHQECIKRLGLCR